MQPYGPPGQYNEYDPMLGQQGYPQQPFNGDYPQQGYDQNYADPGMQFDAPKQPAMINGQINWDADEEDLLELDMFKIEEKEMRKFRGVNGWWVFITGVMMIAINAMAMATPSWRTNMSGVVGYGGQRSWGLWMVSGKSTLMHHKMYDETCRRMGQFMFMGLCSSPICRWYQIKCMSYRQIMMSSYACGALIVAATFLFLLCTIWTWHFNLQSLRWASSWWAIAVCLQGAGVAGYVFLTDEAFSQLNSESYYPVPFFSTGFFAASFVILFGIINMTLACILYSKWSNSVHVKEDDETETEDEDEIRIAESQDVMNMNAPYATAPPYSQGSYPGPGYGAYPQH